MKTERYAILDADGTAIARGDRVQILGGSEAQGRVLAAYLGDPQGFEGCLTIDLGNGVHEYVPPRRLRRVPSEPKDRQ